MSKDNLITTRAVWIDCARVLATLLIVIYHLPSSDFNLNGLSSDIWGWCNVLFSNPVGALCFFFVLAGYFTSRHMSWSKWRGKWLMLFSSFVLWNSIFVLGLSDDLSISRIYGIGTGHQVCADYPLWFVRDLLLMLLFFPIMRRFPLAVMLFCASLSIIDVLNPIAFFIEYPVFSTAKNWFFFTLGFYLNRFTLDTIKLKVQQIGIPISVVVLAISAYFYYQGYMLSFPLAGVLLPFCYACVITSIGLCFEACASQRLLRVVASVAPFTFLCYALHAGIISGVSRVLSRFAPALNSSEWIPLCLALLIMLISYMSYSIIRSYCPFLLPLLCNERRK